MLWLHSQLHRACGFQQLYRVMTLVVCKELQGSMPWPTVRAGVLSPTNMLEQPRESKWGKATGVCKRALQKANEAQALKAGLSHPLPCVPTPNRKCMQPEQRGHTMHMENEKWDTCLSLFIHARSVQGWT